MSDTIDGVEFVTADELVNRYRGKVTKRTLANWRSTGDGPKPTKIGGRVLYRTTDVLVWERSRQPKARA